MNTPLLNHDRPPKLFRSRFEYMTQACLMHNPSVAFHFSFQLSRAPSGITGKDPHLLGN
ncbi:uncharacterized protein METZ01_LOCUS464396 [marine metagenome]|uniref:Uncharacterized protein n=1 Tax=marine metagenome TaxID=408172 RepID=A0A383AUZ4_9ZZZZ